MNDWLIWDITKGVWLIVPMNFLVWREFLWGGIAGAFGEGMMHPVDTIKTRIQSQAIFNGPKVIIFFIINGSLYKL